LRAVRVSCVPQLRPHENPVCATRSIVSKCPQAALFGTPMRDLNPNPLSKWSAQRGWLALARARSRAIAARQCIDRTWFQAQQGMERRSGAFRNKKVRGSNPLSSTNPAVQGPCPPSLRRRTEWQLSNCSPLMNTPGLSIASSRGLEAELARLPVMDAKIRNDNTASRPQLQLDQAVLTRSE